MIKFDDFLKQELQDSEIKEEMDKLEPEFQVVRAVLDARKEAGMTQEELASRTGIPQANISKIENGNANPSVATLQKLAFGMGKKLVISFA